jgi:hypothetical protein
LLLSITQAQIKNTPRGDEQNSLKGDSNVTYNSGSVKRWPESGTDSAKTPKIDTSELPSDLAEIVAVWPELAEDTKATIKGLIQTHSKGIMYDGMERK